MPCVGPTGKTPERTLWRENHVNSADGSLRGLCKQVKKQSKMLWNEYLLICFLFIVTNSLMMLRCRVDFIKDVLDLLLLFARRFQNVILANGGLE